MRVRNLAEMTDYMNCTCRWCWIHDNEEIRQGENGRILGI